MFKTIAIALALVSVSAFGFFAGSAPAAETGKKVASANATMQKNNPAIATRLLHGGTRIKMHFGDTVIPGTLNDSETAQALIKMLPYTVRVNR